MEKHRVLFDSLEWQSLIHGARFKVFRSGTKQLRLVEFTSEFVELDWCEKGHIGFVFRANLKLIFTDTLCVTRKVRESSSRRVWRAPIKRVQLRRLFCYFWLRKFKSLSLDSTTSHSTKPASGRVAGYPAKAGIQMI